MKHGVKPGFIRLKQIVRSIYKKITRTILAYPMRSFFGVLGVLFLLILIGNALQKPPAATPEQTAPKTVRLYSIGSAPKIAVTATVEKSGVVTLVAQTSGIVQTIYKPAGQAVNRGSWVIGLSGTYQGGSMQSVSRQIAQKNFDFVSTSYDTQKDMIGKRRQIAQTMNEQSVDLKNITNDSLEDTRNTVSFNEELLTTLNDQITYLEQTNVGGANNALILQAKQGKAGVLAALGSLRSALRSTQYQAADGTAPNELASLQKDLTLKQLDMEEKSLDLNKELSLLNLRVAQIAESLLYPASPVTGTVERIHVRLGQNVNPGTTLATITGATTHTTAVALIPVQTARLLSRIEPSIVHIGNQSIPLLPSYISQEPTDGQLASVLYQIPDELANSLADNTSLVIDIPVGSVQSTGAIPYVPLDTVYQTNDQSYVFVASKSAEGIWRAASHPVTLGNVFGQFVEVTQGLTANDQVIVSRTVLDGDELTVQ